CTSSRPSSSTAWNTKACAPKSELAPPVKNLSIYTYSEICMRSSSRFSLAACSAAAALVLAACSGGNTANPPSAGEESSQAEGGETLVIDTAFSLATGDRGRPDGPTGHTEHPADDDAAPPAAGTEGAVARA